MEAPNHLIIVCGHAIWAGGPTNGHDEAEWIIESWKKGETPTYMEHVKAGVKALGEDDRSILMFSGAPTAVSTPLSEGRSYANLAAANDYWGLLPHASATGPQQQPHHALSPVPLHPRVQVEERALDSHQNILFSVVQFWRNCGSIWPSRLTVVSHAFKRRRLTDEHCAAISFPLEHVAFIGINPPTVPPVLPQEEAAVEVWRGDPHGLAEPLREKRRARNRWGVDQTLFLSDDERRRSGIKTELIDDGKEEVLVDGGLRPWQGSQRTRSFAEDIQA